MRSWDEGDASVPTPHNPTPAPTGTKRLPRGCHAYLPSWSSAFLFAHVCVLHAKQMKQVKQVKQMIQVKQTASKTRFKEPTLERRRRGTIA